jgi:hypothetical protein
MAVTADGEVMVDSCAVAVGDGRGVSALLRAEAIRGSGAIDNIR